MTLEQLQEDRTALVGELHEAIGLPDGQLAEGEFNALALKLFAHQYRHMGPYRNLCDSRGVAPGKVSDWTLVPPVPTTAFRELILFAGPDGEAAHTFSTSGTTQGVSKGRSCFSKDGLALMERSILVNAKRMLLPDVRRKIHILVLAPSPKAAPQMIMAWGMSRLIRHFGTRKSRFLIGREGLDVPVLLKRLGEFQEKGEPVTLIGASFGFVNLLEALRAKGISFRLPPGSRTMDAGGYKGRSRELTREQLEEWLGSGFGIAAGHAVNLLGMTELASQFYDDTLEKTAAGETPARLKANPPWTRTRAVDPLTLVDVQNGEEGILLHMDLANLDTPFNVLTDDVGIVYEEGFRILGRLTSDQSRGCSLTVDELTRSRT